MMSLPNTLPTPNTIRPQSVTQLLTSYRPIEAQPLTIPSTLLTLLCPIPSTGNMLFLLLSNGTPNHPLKPISNTPSSVNSFFTIACQVHWLNNHNFFLRALQRQKKKVLVIPQPLPWREESYSSRTSIFPPSSQPPFISFPKLDGELIQTELYCPTAAGHTKVLKIQAS